MTARLLLLTVLLAKAMTACADEDRYLAEMVCKKCLKAPNPENIVPCTTGKPYKVSIGEISLTENHGEVIGKFEFSTYTTLGPDEHNLNCVVLRGIGGEFTGVRHGNNVQVKYFHSWNGSGEPDMANIIIRPATIEWQSLGSQHGYLGIMPKRMELSKVSNIPFLRTGRTPASASPNSSARPSAELRRSAR